MEAVPPIRRRGRPPKAKKELITFEMDPSKGPLSTYRLMGGREIIVYMASKRKASESRPCCAYCDRIFPKPVSRPLTPSRIQELDRRSQKTLEKSGNVVADAIAKLRRNDELKKQPPKSDEEYMQEIFAALKSA